MISFGTSIRTKYRAAIDGTGKLNDNNWHRIQVIRTLWELSVKIDDKVSLDPATQLPLQPLKLSGNGQSRLDINLPMFVGSSWRYPAYLKGYVGCMKGFVSNNYSFIKKVYPHTHSRARKQMLNNCRKLVLD